MGYGRLTNSVVSFRWTAKELSHTHTCIQFSCSAMSDSVTPWTAARQASPSITNSRSLLKLMHTYSFSPKPPFHRGSHFLFLMWVNFWLHFQCVVGPFPHQAILQHHLDVLQFNSNPILFSQRWHHIPQLKGSAPQTAPHFRHQWKAQVLWLTNNNWRFQRPPA